VRRCCNTDGRASVKVFFLNDYRLNWSLDSTLDGFGRCEHVLDLDFLGLCLCSGSDPRLGLGVGVWAGLCVGDAGGA